MEVSRRTDYAIRILLELAREGGGPVSVRRLAEGQEVPYAFARGIQRDLVAAGLVRSQRGATGGIILARPAKQITLLDVVEATEGGVSCAVCTSDPSWCRRMSTCSVHAVWHDIDDMVAGYLRTKSLAGLIEQERGR